MLPRAWKTSAVVPIPKTDNNSDVKNYRPISLLSVTSKLLKLNRIAEKSVQCDNWLRNIKCTLNYIPESIKHTKLVFSAILLSFARDQVGISFCKL